MLPQLHGSILDQSQVSNRLLRRIVNGLCIAAVLFLLAACSESQPPRVLLNEALSLQIQLTQTTISTSLDLAPMTVMPSISRIRVEEQEPVWLGELRGLRVSGRFDWQLPGDRVQVDSLFEVYLQQGERYQSWRLARPSGGDADNRQTWQIYPLGLG
ncbi:hypothetical protein [Synechococcus sp. M16CYN]|uniref:hypothetical protein n=1 Tax=Synechococcus sp. M16CYN TaxID=3103139 RepID=UPI0030E4B8F3